MSIVLPAALGRPRHVETTVSAERLMRGRRRAEARAFPHWTAERNGRPVEYLRNSEMCDQDVCFYCADIADEDARSQGCSSKRAQAVSR